MKAEELKDKIKLNKELSNGKSSKDCSLKELAKVYKQTVCNAKTEKEKLDSINAFRCGW